MGWLQTYTGKQVTPLKPDVASIDIVDVAHALSNICRFNGHTREFYSVAQHSVLVCDGLTGKARMAGLLHDASEAYLCDIPKPIKHQLPGYREMEETLQAAIYSRFDVWITPEIQADVKEADHRALATEAYQLMNPANSYFDLPAFSHRAYDDQLYPLPPKVAKQVFLSRYEQLVRGICL